MSQSYDKQKSELFSQFSSALLGDVKEYLLKAVGDTGGPISVDPDGPVYDPSGPYLIVRIGNITTKLAMSLLSDDELKDYITQKFDREY